FPSGAGLPEFLCQISRTGAEALGVERVSLWLFSEDGRTLQQESLYRRSTDACERGARLHRADYPRYFGALAEGDMLAAEDALRDRRTSELAGPYLEPLGIGALLGVPVYVQGRMEGALCYEHVGSARLWTSDERIFAAATASLVAMGISQARCLRALHESKEAGERYRRLVECASDALLVHDLEGRFVEINEQACRSLGYGRDELLRLSVSQIDLGYDAVQSPRLWAGLRADRPILRETVYRRKDGAPCFVEERLGRLELGGKALVLCMARDVTERRRLEESLRQVQRMEALGRLAGGVAHDFNNLLTAISGYARLLAGSPPEAPSRAYAEQILRAADQAAEVARQLLAFSQKQVMAPRDIHVNRLIREAERLLRPLFPQDVRLEFSLAEHLPPVKADPAQLQQVLVHLALRARDALERGGTVVVETRHVHLREPEPAHAGEVPPGEYVVLCVSDTGRGLEAEERARLFEPFAGSAGEGGRQLALSAVYGIVRQSGGHLRVRSAPGEGSRFEVFLPRASEAAGPLGEAPAAAARPAGREAILLAEDSDSIRGLIREVLRTRGYRVFEARNGAEGLEAFREHADEIDLVVTDVVMPEMSGVEMVREIRARAPRVPVLFLSAYPDYSVETEGPLDFPGAWFLAKPFSPAELLEEVERIIAACPRVPRGG
ncbi:MAG: response regulator, partial [Planctomycetota bacterium]